jgi:hypothetical protein
MRDATSHRSGRVDVSAACIEGTAGDVEPLLPPPIGPHSEHVNRLLVDRVPGASPDPSTVPDPLGDDDLHRALYCCYELHYRGFAGVDAAKEWDPAVLAHRRSLEDVFERSLRDEVAHSDIRPADVVDSIAEAVGDAGGPSLSSFMESHGTLDQMREFAVHRSAYQLKEADPHTWAIPRFDGDAKAALVHIQSDEYGSGRAAHMHSTLFACTMQALGLDPTYGAYIDVLPGTTLATVNLVSMFGLHRRLRGAAVGHLTVFEMTSVVPMGRYARASARLGLPSSARRFYDVHVLADADHEVVALDRMARAVAHDDPRVAGDVVFGARAVLEIERRFAEALLCAWSSGTTSLRTVEPVAA